MWCGWVGTRFRHLLMECSYRRQRQKASGLLSVPHVDALDTSFLYNHGPGYRLPFAGSAR